MEEADNNIRWELWLVKFVVFPKMSLQLKFEKLDPPRLEFPKMSLQLKFEKFDELESFPKMSLQLKFEKFDAPPPEISLQLKLDGSGMECPPFRFDRVLFMSFWIFRICFTFSKVLKR